MAEAEEAEADLAVAQDALAEAECDSFDASNRAWRTHLDGDARDHEQTSPIGFQAPLGGERPADCTEADRRFEEAKHECARLAAIVGRADLRHDRAQRVLRRSCRRLLKVAKRA